MKLITALILSITALTAQAGDLAECNRVWKSEKGLANDPTGHFYQLCIKPSASIGMSRVQVLNNTEWGKPEKIYTTTTALGTSEQWKYWPSGYLYFTNGKLTAIQN